MAAGKYDNPKWWLGRPCANVLWSTLCTTAPAICLNRAELARETPQLSVASCYLVFPSAKDPQCNRPRSCDLVGFLFLLLKWAAMAQTFRAHGPLWWWGRPLWRTSSWWGATSSVLASTEKWSNAQIGGMPSKIFSYQSSSLLTLGHWGQSA